MHTHTYLGHQIFTEETVRSNTRVYFKFSQKANAWSLFLPAHFNNVTYSLVCSKAYGFLWAQPTKAAEACSLWQAVSSLLGRQDRMWLDRLKIVIMRTSSRHSPYELAAAWMSLFVTGDFYKCSCLHNPPSHPSHRILNMQLLFVTHWCKSGSHLKMEFNVSCYWNVTFFSSWKINEKIWK